MLRRLFTLLSAVSLALFGAVGVLWVARPDAKSLNPYVLVEFRWQGRRWAVDSVPRGIAVSDRPELLVDEARLEQDLAHAAGDVAAAERRAREAEHLAVAAGAALPAGASAADAARLAALRKEWDDLFNDMRSRQRRLNRLTSARTAVVRARIAAITNPRLTYGRAAAITAVLPVAWLAYATRRQWVVRRRMSRNLCPACGYDLRGTPDRCPECGRASPGVGRKVAMQRVHA